MKTPLQTLIDFMQIEHMTPNRSAGESLMNIRKKAKQLLEVERKELINAREDGYYSRGVDSNTWFTETFKND